ncbi:MAG: hypothetical protein Q9227_004867 [Pyrenula ochraceoflavens]
MTQTALLCVLVAVSIVGAGVINDGSAIDYINESTIQDDSANLTGLFPYINSTLHRRWNVYSSPAIPWPVRMVNAGQKIDLSGGGQAGMAPGQAIENAGYGVQVYVLDGGMRITHDHFNLPGRPGRAVNFRSVPSNQESPYVAEDKIPSGMHDVDGHGTFVGSTVLEFAPGALIVNVKWKGREKSGHLSEAIDDVVEEHKSYQQNPPYPAWRGSVINYSAAMESFGDNELEGDNRESIKKAWEAGIPFVAASGNEGENPPPADKSACRFVPHVICVAAVDRNYAMWQDSNQGSEVEVLAPGVDMQGANFISDHAVKTDSGTSVATPVVAAIMAQIIACEGINNDVQAVFHRLVTNAIYPAIAGIHGSQVPRLPTFTFPRPVYQPGVPKKAGEKYSRTLVIARTSKEYVGWIFREFHNDDLSYAIYTVDDPSANLTVPVNKGNEMMVYLTYIIDNYEKLDDISIFMHSHQYGWHNNEILQENAVYIIQRLNLEKVIRDGYMVCSQLLSDHRLAILTTIDQNLRCHHRPGCVAPKINLSKPRHHPDVPEEPIVATAWAELFGALPPPPTLAQPCCGQYAASRDRIRAIPLEQYIHFRDWLIHTPHANNLSGRIWEHIWQFVLAGVAEFCPSESLCYCDGFGVCFGGDEKYNEYVKKQEEVKTLEGIVKRALEDEHTNLVVDESYTGVNAGVNIEKLNQQVRNGKKWLVETKQAAIKRGKDPEARRKEVEMAGSG